MKKVLKWLGAFVGAIVLLVGCFLLYINFVYDPHFEVKLPTVQISSTPERLTRGRELVLTLCAECHRDPLSRQLTGRLMGDLPEMFGTAYSRNITKDPVYGIGAWSDAEIVWLLRTGIHPKTGRFIPPWMVKLTGMADEDIYSIVSFLRSDDPVVAAAQVQSRDSKASLFAKVLTFAGAFKPFDYPTAPIAKPDTADAVAYGRYVANGVFGCYDCHSADFASNDRQMPEKSVGYYGGGNKMPDYEKLLVPTKNITPSKVFGIGLWTEENFVQTLRTGFRPNGSLLRYPMMRLSHVPDAELRAMYRYLQTIPAIEKAAGEAELAEVPAGASAGERIYRYRGCVHCHGKNGLAYADLQLAYKKYSNDSLLRAYIMNPELTYPGTVMPHFEGRISSDELNDLVAYVRELGKASGR